MTVDACARTWPAYPLPDGTLMQIIDHYEKTVRFVRALAGGEVACAPPRGFRLPDGFRFADEETREESATRTADAG